MTAVDAQPAKLSLVGQISRFVLIGGFCALVDYGVYQGLLALGLWVHAAKALSFIAGTTTAFFLNRRYTFAASNKNNLAQIGAFALLYTVTFFVNVGTNALVLNALPENNWQITLAWLTSQAVATTINFIMLRTVVFRNK